MSEEVQLAVITFFESDYLLWGLVTLLVVILYRTLFGPNQPKEVECVKFNNKSTKFEAIRRKTFPGPYPNGWYNIGVSNTIKKGEIKNVSCLGVDLVIFRGNDNKIGVLDAHCPHIGAHLGMGGKVIDNTIECPFHGWRFNIEGKCVHIPYTDKDVPCVARTKAWYFREKLGMIWIWFDADDSPPRYEMVDIPEVEKGEYYYGGVLQLTFNQHISEMFENAADYHHFNTLHSPFPFPFLGRFIKIHHFAELTFPFREDPEKRHLCHFVQRISTLRIFNLFNIPFSGQEMRTTYEGPSIMHFRISTPLGNFYAVKTVLPVKPFQQYSEDHWWANWKVPRWYGKLVAMMIHQALEQDRLVWENKIYRPRPILVQGDGPFSNFRKWYNQHYSAASKDVSHSYLDW